MHSGNRVIKQEEISFSIKMMFQNISLRILEVLEHRANGRRNADKWPNLV